MRSSVGQFLEQATALLTSTGIATARLDCLVLLEDALNMDRAQLLAHGELELGAEQQKQLNELVQRRAAHEPLAYIRRRTEFYGREFYIDQRVLEPRPESEAMIDQLKQLPLGESAVIVDVGTGSGALAITAKVELPGLEVYGTDIDPSCLAVTSHNIETHHVPLRLLQGDLLAPITKARLRPTVLLCNLPYVPDGFTINPAAMREPRLAIFGGPDGLDLYRKLFAQVQKLTVQRPAYILTEALPPQHDALSGIAAGAGCQLIRTDDFVQVFRTSSEPGSAN